MSEQILRNSTRLNTRNNRLLLTTNGVHCCCGPDVDVFLFRGCCDTNKQVWLLATLLNSYITNIRYRDECYNRTGERATTKELDQRNIDWFGQLPNDMTLLHGDCDRLVSSGHCPPCEPSGDVCCYTSTRLPCRIDAMTFQPYETQESRCCVHGSGHSIEITERFSLIEWGWYGAQRVNTVCTPRERPFSSPLYQIDITKTIRGFARCPDAAYQGTTTYVQTGIRYITDGSEVVGDDIIEINPRYQDLSESYSYPFVFDFSPNNNNAIRTTIGMPINYLYLPEREPTPGAGRLLSICDGVARWVLDYNDDGFLEGESDAFVIGNIQCNGGSIVYRESGLNFYCAESIPEGPRFDQFYRVRQSIEWRYFDIERDRCQPMTCSDLGRPGPNDPILSHVNQSFGGHVAACRTCREQPGL